METMVSETELGEMLKVQRKKIGFTQADVAQKLGYKNLNFVSMIEKGKSNVPFARLTDFCKAYELPVKFSLVIIAARYPDYFGTLFDLFEDMSITLKDTGLYPRDEIEEIVTHYQKILV